MSYLPALYIFQITTAHQTYAKLYINKSQLFKETNLWVMHIYYDMVHWLGTDGAPIRENTSGRLYI